MSKPLSERVEFSGAQGDKLAARLDRPVGKPRAFALFAHCFTCGKSLKVIRRISEQLTAEGISLLRFDFTGLGQSEGEFAETTFTSNLGDLTAAADFLAREHEAPAIIAGHSLGGAAVLAAAERINGVRCVATIAAPSAPAHVRHLLTGSDAPDRDGAVEVRPVMVYE